MSGAPEPPLAAQLHPPLPLRAQVWRYLIAVALGAAAWIATAADLASGPLTRSQEDAVGAALVLDLTLGVLTLTLLPVRRRYPLAVTCLITAVSALSMAAMGPATLAIVSMASWRRRVWVAVVAVVFLAGTIVSEVLWLPRFSSDKGGAFTATGGIVLALMYFAATVATGYYVGARRELVTSLHERVLTAERERSLTTQAARDGERTRIAREMHDVLAHRISLVALHAGALTYREDLSRAQTAETARTIQANAQLALAELRQVLGVLRTVNGTDHVEQPQPTLTELPALLADARETGTSVALDSSGLDKDHGRQLPETLSRTAFRIVQETLTNARRHAPGEPVGMRLAGTPGGHLEVEVRNRVGGPPHAGPDSTGFGLAGLTERSQLAGGTLEYGAQPDGSFVVRAMLPWPR